MRFLAFFLLLPLIELAIFIYAGSEFGFWPTIAAMLATSLLGGWVLRGQGRHIQAVMQRAGLSPDGTQAGARTAAPDAGGLAGVAMRQIAGILLLLPGFLTDAFGLLLLLPPVQKLLVGAVAQRFRGFVMGRAPGFGSAGFGGPGFGGAGMGPGGFGPQASRSGADVDSVIEGEAVEIVEAPRRLPGASGQAGRPASGWSRED